MTSFVDKKRLEEISKLAMLEIKENEIEKYLNLMNQSIETLEALDKINVDNEKELVNPYDMALLSELCRIQECVALALLLLLSHQVLVEEMVY